MRVGDPNPAAWGATARTNPNATVVPAPVEWDPLMRLAGQRQRTRRPRDIGCFFRESVASIPYPATSPSMGTLCKPVGPVGESRPVLGSTSGLQMREQLLRGRVASGEGA